MNMKMNKYLLSGLLAAAVGLLAASCTKDEVTYKVGTKPDKETIETVAGTLRSSRSLRDRVSVHLTEDSDEKATDKIYFRLNQPVAEAVTVTAVPDASLVKAYNAEFSTDLLPLPEANIRLADNGKITVPAGERESARLALTIDAAGLEPGIYLMPVVVNPDSEGSEPKVLYYGVTIREFDKNMIQQGDDTYDAELDTEWTTVFYLNTSEAQAHYADYVAYYKQNLSDFHTVARKTLGNIIILRISMVDYDAASKRALFAPTTDLRYTVEHDSKYLAQMRDKGRKICVCIEGGGKGIGFCNMTPAQIADFVEQVKAFVTLYDLDGVNLWDRGAGYDNPDAPAVNTTSYPALIKALHEAMPDKMLTVVDYGEPTETFHDTKLTGDIAVGDYIDYAWSGYASRTEYVTFTNPYNPNTDYQQRVERKPFAGLDEARYGNVMVPFYDAGDEWFNAEEEWMYDASGWNASRVSNLLVFDDLRLPQAVAAESGCLDMMNQFFMNFEYDYDGNEMPFRYSVNMRIPGIYREGIKNYEKFYKDW